MSEVELQQVVTEPGKMLRAAREAKGLSVQAVAEKLRLTPQTVIDLETDNYSNLAKVYSRGYLRTYALFLQLDVGSLLQAHDRIHSALEQAKPHTVKIIKTLPSESPLSWRFMRFSVFALIILIAGAVLFWWYEQSQTQQKVSTAVAVSDLQQVEIQGFDGSTEIHSFQASNSLADEPEITEQTVETTTDTAAIASETDNSTASTATDSTADSATQPAVESEPETAAPAAPAVPEGQGQFVADFSGECWLSVSDANGKVLFSGTKRANEQLDVIGKAPLAVRIGLTSSVAKATYNGELIDLSQYSSGKTARLKLGQ